MGARGFWDFGLRPSCRENGPPSTERPRGAQQAFHVGSVRVARPAENAGRAPCVPASDAPRQPVKQVVADVKVRPAQRRDYAAHVLRRQ